MPAVHARCAAWKIRIAPYSASFRYARVIIFSFPEFFLMSLFCIFLYTPPLPSLSWCAQKKLLSSQMMRHRLQICKKRGSLAMPTLPLWWFSSNSIVKFDYWKCLFQQYLKSTCLLLRWTNYQRRVTCMQLLELAHASKTDAWREVFRWLQPRWFHFEHSTAGDASVLQCYCRTVHPRIRSLRIVFYVNVVISRSLPKVRKSNSVVHRGPRRSCNVQ